MKILRHFIEHDSINIMSNLWKFHFNIILCQKLQEIKVLANLLKEVLYFHT